jgi:hypothetical protein
VSVGVWGVRGGVRGYGGVDVRVRGCGGARVRGYGGIGVRGCRYNVYNVRNREGDKQSNKA